MSEATSPSLLENLRQQGADRFDPVRFHYLESFEQRLRMKGLEHCPHWQKLEQAVWDYQARLEGFGQPEPITAASAPSPLSLLLDRLDQKTETPVEIPRSALEQRVFGEDGELAQAHRAPSFDNPPPLKAMVKARADRGTHALQERIRHAIESIPQDAGPMNAHRLVGRAIAEMQRLSPEYLERFARYTDTLMALERMAKKG